MQKDEDNFQVVRRASAGISPGNATSTMMFARVSGFMGSALASLLFICMNAAARFDQHWLFASACVVRNPRQTHHCSLASATISLHPHISAITC